MYVYTVVYTVCIACVNSSDVCNLNRGKHEKAPLVDTVTVYMYIHVQVYEFIMYRPSFHTFR